MVDNEILDFVKQFTGETVVSSNNIIEIDKQFFLVNDEQRKLVEDIEKKSDIEPFSVGTYLGNTKKKMFKPSIAFLDMIASQSDMKLFVDQEGEMHFLYGKDLFGKAIIRGTVDKGLALIQNEKDENLGYGKVINFNMENNSNKVVVKNILDRGDFIRRDVV